MHVYKTCALFSIYYYVCFEFIRVVLLTFLSLSINAFLKINLLKKEMFECYYHKLKILCSVSLLAIF